MRDKIKLESSAGTGHFTTTKNKHYARQTGNQKIRSGLPHKHVVYKSQTEIISV